MGVAKVNDIHAPKFYVVVKINVILTGVAKINGPKLLLFF